MSHFLQFLIDDRALLNKLQWELAIIFAFMMVGSLVMHLTEGWSYFDSFYFSVITFATIGYGDLVPHTIIGKSMTMIYAFVAVPVFLYTSSIILASRGRKIARKVKMELEHDLSKEIQHDIQTELRRKNVWKVKNKK